MRLIVFFWYFGRACSNLDLQLAHTWISGFVNRDQSHAWGAAGFFLLLFYRKLPFGRVSFAWLSESACDVHSVDIYCEFVLDAVLHSVSFFSPNLDFVTLDAEPVKVWRRVTCFIAQFPSTVHMFRVIPFWYLFNRLLLMYSVLYDHCLYIVIFNDCFNFTSDRDRLPEYISVAHPCEKH